MILICSLLIGVACGLRTMIGLAFLSWAARLHFAPLEGTPFAFMGYLFTPWLFTGLALVELYIDKQPSTGSRLQPGGFIGRSITGGLCGAALGATAHHILLGLALGLVGAVIGTVGGAKVRGVLARTFGKDLPAAFLEDGVAFCLCILAIYAIRL